MSRFPLLLLFGTLAACKPPATDEYVARVGLEERQGPGTPLVSPDTNGAVWAPGREARRIIFGKPGEPPLFALQCRVESGRAEVVYTRHAPADPEAEAVLALIGNGHVVRLWIDATRDGERWLWRGSVPADSAQLEVLTGPRQVEATVPGAGSVILNASALPGQLINECRGSPDRSASPA